MGVILERIHDSLAAHEYPHGWGWSNAGKGLAYLQSFDKHGMTKKQLFVKVGWWLTDLYFKVKDGWWVDDHRVISRR